MKRLIIFGLFITILITASCPLFTGNVVAECEALKTQSFRDTCYAELAPILEDKAVCAKIISATAEDTCVNLVAVALNDAEFCLQIGASNILLQNSCLETIAVELVESPICLNLSNDSLRGTCTGKIVLINGNLSACGELPLAQVKDKVLQYKARDYCWNHVATSGNAPELCANIFDEELRESCEA